MDADAPFLSKEWIDELPTLDVDSDGNLTVQYTVTDAPGGDVQYWVHASGGHAAFEVGNAEDPDVTISETYDTAIALRDGRLGAAEAVTTGLVRVTGEPAVLARNAELLTKLADALSRTSAP